jgi:hypothetical protein
MAKIRKLPKRFEVIHCAEVNSAGSTQPLLQSDKSYLAEGQRNPNTWFLQRFVTSLIFARQSPFSGSFAPPASG